MKSRLALNLLRVFTCASLLSCESGDDDRIAQGQACLDKADQSNVGECEEKVAGIRGPRAALVRCSANFIAQGFTGTRFASAFAALQTTTAGQNSTVAMMSFLVFTVGGSNAARRTAVETAVTNCTDSGFAGMIMFANFARAGTELSIGLSIDPNTPPTPAQLQAQVDAFSGSESNLGSAMIAISNVYCSTSAASSDVEFCSAVNQAAAAGGPEAVGEAMLTLLDVT